MSNDEINMMCKEYLDLHYAKQALRKQLKKRIAELETNILSRINNNDFELTKSGIP